MRLGNDTEEHIRRKIYKLEHKGLWFNDLNSKSMPVVLASGESYCVADRMHCSLHSFVIYSYYWQCSNKTQWHHIIDIWSFSPSLSNDRSKAPRGSSACEGLVWEPAPSSRRTLGHWSCLRNKAICSCSRMQSKSADSSVSATSPYKCALRKTRAASRGNRATGATSTQPHQQSKCAAPKIPGAGVYRTISKHLAKDKANLWLQYATSLCSKIEGLNIKNKKCFRHFSLKLNTIRKKKKSL